MSSFFPWQRGEQQWKQRKDRQSFILTQSGESVLLRPPLHYQALERQGERATSSQRKRALPQWVQRCRKRFDFSRLQAIPIPEAIIEPFCVSSITYLSDLLTLVVHSSAQNYIEKKPSYTSFLKCRLRVRDSKRSLHRNLRSHQVKPIQIHRYPRLQILYNEGERRSELYTPSSHWSSIRPSQPAMTSLPNLQLGLKNQEALWSPHTYPKKTLQTQFYPATLQVTNEAMARNNLSPPSSPPSRPPTLNLKNQEALRPPHTYEEHVQENSTSPHYAQ